GVARGALFLWIRDEACDLKSIRLVIDFDQLVQQPAAEHLIGSFLQRSRRHHTNHIAPVVDQQKRELRIGQRVVLNEIGDVKALSRIALQKLAACGEIEEEVAHFNFGASRPCDVADGDQLAAVKLYLGAFSVRGSFSSKEQ